MKRSKTIERAIARRPEMKIDYWCEPENRDGHGGDWWLFFANGYTHPLNPSQHQWGGTVADCVEQIRGAVKCRCQDCERERAAGRFPA